MDWVAFAEQVEFAGGSRAVVGRQRLWDQTSDLSSGDFLNHRNPKESEDEQSCSILAPWPALTPSPPA